LARPWSADHAARPGPQRQPVAEALAEHLLKQPDVVLERWQQRLALLPAKRLPFLATALQGVGAENAVTASDLDSLDK
jgi:hypothetical protein